MNWFQAVEAADVVAGYVNACNLTDTLASASSRKRSSRQHRSGSPSAL